METVIGNLVAFTIGIGIILIIYRKSKSFKIIELENCNKEDILNWFREEKLKNNIPIILRKGNNIQELNEDELLLCIFDNQNNKIVKGIVYKYTNISNEILEMFNKQNMIVLK